jgi:hypothetical protein
MKLTQERFGLALFQHYSQFKIFKIYIISTGLGNVLHVKTDGPHTIRGLI